MNKIIFIFILFSLGKAFANNQKNKTALVYSQQTSVMKNGFSTVNVESVDRVETEAGRTELAITKINFPKSSAKFKLIEAFTLFEGKKSMVSPTGVLIRNADKAIAGIGDMMEAVIQFNNVQIGCEVHLRYELAKTPNIDGIFSDMLGVSNFILAKKEFYSFKSEVPLHYRSIDFKNNFEILVKKPEKEFTISPTKMAYQLEGIKEVHGEISISSAKSWAEVKNAEEPKYRKALNGKVPKKYLDIVDKFKKSQQNKELLNGVAASLSKVISYSGDWTTQQGKFVPQPMEKVANFGKGDCKDFSTAMVAVLRRLNYEAFPFLTFRSKKYEGEEKLKEWAQIPNADYFNHVIVWAKDKAGKVWWIDPTNPYVQADNISSDILGNFGVLLNKESADVFFLPGTNEQSADLTIERTFELAADNSVSGSGKMTMAASPYNAVGLAERLYGEKGLNSVIAYLLNPKSQKTEVQVKKKTDKDMTVEFQFSAADWVTDQKKYKTVTSVPPIVSARIDLQTSTDLGEPGVTKYITHIKKQKVENTIQAGCLMRSKWIDIDRVVENLPGELLVTDTLNLKKRFISEKEADGYAFRNFIGEMRDCFSNNELVIHIDPALKSAEFLDRERKNGPMLEAMTDSDAETMFNVYGAQKTGEMSMKLVRYYQKKIKAEPENAEYFYKIGRSLLELGYYSGDDYIPEYLDEAIANYDKAISFGKPDRIPEYTSSKIYSLIYRHNSDNAINEFKKLYKRNPQSFYSFISGAKIALFQKKYKDCEQWALGSEKYIKTDRDFYQYHKVLIDMFSQQNRNKEAIPHLEKIAQKNNDAWAWNNLANAYLGLKDADKAIEIETKVLKMSDFGVARRVMAEAYVLKAKQAPEKGKRSIASYVESRDLLQNAIKYDPENLDALGDLVLSYVSEFENTKDKLALVKAKNYLDQGIKVNPSHPVINTALIVYKMSAERVK